MNPIEQTVPYDLKNCALINFRAKIDKKTRQIAMVFQLGML